MSGTLLSILCGEDSWYWDSNNANTITFNTNGTGELVCRHELNIWIAAEFDWQPHASLDQAVDLHSLPKGTRNNPHRISRFTIKVTLTRRRIPSMRGPEMQRWRLNEALLTDAAFMPKTYSVSLEQGSFVTPYDALLPGEDQYAPRFALRLAFDRSPYPPREEWREPGGAPDAMRMWEWREFCGRESAELKAQEAGRSCVVC